MVRGSCLCGTVAFEAEAPFELMHHCHCSRCRKAHGSPFATYAGVAEDRFRWTSGRDSVARHESIPAFFRCFCGRCGSVVPGAPADGKVFIPVGLLDEDPGARPLAHIFYASRAPWYEAHDSLPRFDAYPEGFDAAVVPDRPPLDPPGGLRGSCLCGGVTYVVDGAALRAWSCHCSRCRKARSAAHASNLFTTADGVRFTRGEDLVVEYKVPEARYFRHRFCRACGSSMPRIDRERNLAVVPMGSLDDDPGAAKPNRNILVSSKAPWYQITADLPQDAELPPSA